MGAGKSIDGRKVTPEELENKIADTFTCCPLPFRLVHASLNGRKNAADVILSAAKHG
jgi:hypothetical protein